MDIQLFLVLIIFLVALFFIGRKVLVGLRNKKAEGCAKCPATSLNIEEKSGKKA